MKKHFPFWKAAGAAYLTLVLLGAPHEARAYIDPSVSSYLIQAIAGVAVAVGAFVAIYWRRARKKVRDRLGLDENANREQEADIQVFEEKK